MTARRITLAIWIAAFLIGTFTHVRDLATDGWLPYRFAPLELNVFWTSLTLLDPLAAALLLTRRNAGIALAIAIMIADVGVNSYALHALDLREFLIPLQLQTLFLGFVFGSAVVIRNP